ncbi:hypothetical protein VTO42DRAFT_8567 [Malbranchea cinnamomea]
METSSSHSAEKAAPNRQVELMNKARAAATFDSYKLTCIIYGGEETVKRRREAFRRVERLTGTADQSKLPRAYANMNREEAYLEGVELGTAAFRDGILYKHDFFDGMDQRYTLSNCTPYGLHYMMFIPTIELQGSPEQIAYWLPLAKSGKINGCYCQTELAHGTFVRGVETTATLDLETDEFVVNSPTLTSAKFWPGAMASSCTHGILMARLIIRGVDYGAHAFIVQLRNVEDFSPVKGIEFGDLGMKMGYNGTTNGYAIFTSVRIPRNNMLMGNARVLKDGTYIKPAHDKVAYLTMLYARAVIAEGSCFKLAQAATIATRYSVVREQGFGWNGEAPKDGGETAIISYRSQNFRLFTLISRAYAIRFTATKLRDAVAEIRSGQAKGDFSSLGYFHVLFAGLKAWNTQIAADGAEEARKSCGGHGFLLTSGLPNIVAEATAPATFEGENYVMYLQVGRALLKWLGLIKAGRPIDKHMFHLREMVERLGHHPDSQRCSAAGSEFLDARIQHEIFEHRFYRLLIECARDLEESESRSGSASSAFNSHMMEIIAAARAYIELLVLEEYIGHVSRIADAAVRVVLTRLRSLFALTTILHPQSYDAISFVEDGYLSPTQMRDIRHVVNGLLDELLPDAIALTDAWDFTDASLCSAIGQYDGNAYERLMSWTRQMPINQNMNDKGSVCRESWERWIRPALNTSLEMKARL